MGATKIATCCYCGTKAALVLRGQDKHELTCSNCGAPLRSLKMLRKDSKAGRSDPHGPRKIDGRKRVERYRDYEPGRRKKRKKNKSFGAK